jgi:hypothetical protein
MMNEFVGFLGIRSNLNLAVVTSKDMAELSPTNENHADSRQQRLNGDITVLSAAFNAALRQAISA